MRSIRMDSLNPAVREFLTQVIEQGGAIIRDQENHALLSIHRMRAPMPEERARALKDMEELQNKVAARMRAQGITEEDVDRVLAEDE